MGKLAMEAIAAHVSVIPFGTFGPIVEEGATKLTSQNAPGCGPFFQ